jgi:integrase
MSLKLIKRGRIYYLRGTVRGRSVFETTGTSEIDQAEELRAAREAELFKASIYGEGVAVSFERAALNYLEFEEREPWTKTYVGRLAKHFGRTLIAKIDQNAAEIAVRAVVGADAAPATKVRAIYGPLTAILRHAAARGECSPPMFRRPKLPRGKTRWLAPAEALALMAGSAPHLRPLLHFLLCTGARLSEALYLDWSDVDLPAAKAVFRDTKNGRDRAAALTPDAILTLANLPRSDDGVRAGPVFRRDDGEPYVDRVGLEGGQIKTAFNGACRRAGLIAWEHNEGESAAATTAVAEGPSTPVRWRATVTPHDLRHTWATWFYAITKDTLLLKAEGGWFESRMVERYAHLMPSELVPEISRVWGFSHPRIGALPREATCAPDVHVASTPQKLT